MSQPFDPNTAGQPYPGQPYPGQPYPGQPYQPVSPPNQYPYRPPAGYAYAPQPLSSAYVADTRSRKRKIGLRVGIGLAAAALIAIVVGVVVAAQPAPAKKIALPTQFDGYSKLDNSASHTVENTIRSSVGSNQAASQIFAVASIGVYSHNTGDVPAVITVALPTSSVPALAKEDSQTVVTQLLSEVATPDQTVPLTGGNHGGAETCTHASFGTVQETLCAWSDRQTTGLLVSIEQPAVAPTTLGATGYVFRDAIE